MKIKSSFKDYYDHIAHIYGGGDPKIVYVRHRLKPLKDLGYSKFDEGLYVDFDINRSLREINSRYEYNPDYFFKYLVIAGKWYLVVRLAGEDKYTVLDEKRHPALVAQLTRRRGDEKHPLSHYLGCEDPQLIELSRLVKAPVFMVEGYCYDYQHTKVQLKIEGAVPILSDLGIPAIYPPEQIYQDIAYFLGNKMHTSPDLEPPAKVDDTTRLVQHGFDKKTSFRPKIKNAA